IILNDAERRKVIYQPTLEEVYQSPELYKAYPELRDIFVAYEDMQNLIEGYYDPEMNMISLNIKLSEGKAKSVLVHEIQHIIQEKEGFTQGTSLEAVWGNEAAKYAREVYEGAKNDAEEQGATLDDEFLMRGAARAAYHHVTGEVQARNVSARMDMTAEERRQKLLSETEDVAREDQIVLMDALSGGESYAQEQTPIQPEDKITREDIQAVRAIPGKSVNDFTSEETQATENWARKFWRELKTKSPFFRAWFGDWRVNDKTPIKTVTVKGTKANLKKGTYKNNDTQWDIEVTNRVVNETENHSKRNRQLFIDALGNIDEIIENAILLDSVTRSEPETDAEIKRKVDYAFMHSLYAVVEDNSTGERFLAKLFVNEYYKQQGDGTKRQAYELRDITKTPL
nr:hypothetical protein [Fretibacterium sp.]